MIDKQRATLYLDAAVMLSSGPRQEIFALSLADGSIEPGLAPRCRNSAPAGVSIRQYRINAARVGAVQGQDLRSLQRTLGRIAVASITALLSAFPLTNRARSLQLHEAGRARRGRRHMGAGRCQRRDGQSLFAVTGNTFGTPGWFGATGVERRRRSRPAPFSRPRKRDRSKAATISAPSNWRDLDRRRPPTSVGPRRSRSMSWARTAPGKLIFAVGKTGEAIFSIATTSAPAARLQTRG